ncbi:MAG: hypothetical protein AN485_23265, partial [Anabaena sp. MDT14b]
MLHTPTLNCQPPARTARRSLTTCSAVLTPSFPGSVPIREPTSQICAECGYKWGKLDLKIRSVKCLNCGTEHDRDENAAKNINKVGIGHCHDSKRAQRQSKTTSVASVGEASRITSPSG